MLLSHAPLYSWRVGSLTEFPRAPPGDRFGDWRRGCPPTVWLVLGNFFPFFLESSDKLKLSTFSSKITVRSEALFFSVIGHFSRKEKGVGGWK